MRTGHKSDQAERSVTVSDLVHDREGRPRWAVTAVFVDVDGAEPRCIDYRVRVVPAMPTAAAAVRAGHQVIAELEKDAGSDRPVYVAAELSAPAEGIPRRVFEQASQSRLIAKARAKVQRSPKSVTAATRRLLDRQQRPRVGRPPLRSLGEKLAVLRTAERIFASGGTLDDVAAEHSMSRSAVRDLLTWARRDSVPPLFTAYGPGRRGGELTAEARQLLEGDV